MFLYKTQLALIRLLTKDGILQKPSACPHCGSASIGSLHYCKQWQGHVYRCSKKSCMKRSWPHSFHPIFYHSKGKGIDLNMQAVILFCATIGIPQSGTHLLLNVDDKAVARIYGNLDTARARHVVRHEKNITYGNWHDIEADEADLGKGLITDGDTQQSGLTTVWEQWGGLVERGRPESLRLFRLNPKNTKARAPGPGPIRKREWRPIATKLLASKQVILHTDGARAHKMKFDQVIHCNAVHQKKKKVIHGKVLKPQYTKVHHVTLPDGKQEAEGDRVECYRGLVYKITSDERLEEHEYVLYRIAMKFLLTRWHNFVAAKEMEKSRLRRLREVFKAWFDVLVMVKHNNALDRLDETKLELENARAKCLKAARRREWLKVQVDRACAMELDFWGSWVLWAWFDVVRVSRDERDSTLQARLARAAATLKLSESMGKAGVDFLKPLVSAWATLVLRQRKARAAAAQRVYGVGSDTLRKVFQAWQEIKNAEFENIKRQLRRKEEDFQELQSLSSRLYTFSKHASSRVEHLESALRAAERALFAGQDRGETLEREVLGLQSQLQQEAMISESRLRQQLGPERVG
ncbi:unnamed protein product, partial [Symbiodinium necroappetens]